MSTIFSSSNLTPGVSEVTLRSKFSGQDLSAAGHPVVINERIAKGTMQLVAQASSAYLKKDYRKAIQFYSKGLELEKERPMLDLNHWRVVVDNLGMSYGISEDNK